MKKFLIILVAAIGLSGLPAMGQVYYYRTYAYAERSNNGNGWTKWSNFVSSPNILVTINLNTDVIKFANKLGSTFSIYDSEVVRDSNGEEQLVCKAYDEEGLRCKVRLITRRDGTNQIYIDYNDVGWCYNIRRVNQ